MAIEIRRTHAYLKGLAEVRARVDADVQRFQKIHDEITAKLAAAFSERESCDCLIRKYDQRLDPNQIQPIRAWKGRYGSRGALQRSMTKMLEEVWPEALTRTLRPAFSIY